LLQLYNLYLHFVFKQREQLFLLPYFLTWQMIVSYQLMTLTVSSIV